MSFQEHWEKFSKGTQCFDENHYKLASLFYSKGHFDGAREVLAASARNFEEQIKRAKDRNPPQRIDGTVDEYLA